MKRNVVLCLLTLLSMQVFAQKQSQVVDKIVAVVGKNVILQSDVENQYMQYRLQGGAEVLISRCIVRFWNRCFSRN